MVRAVETPAVETGETTEAATGAETAETTEAMSGAETAVAITDAKAAATEAGMVMATAKMKAATTEVPVNGHEGGDRIGPCRPWRRTERLS